MQEKALAVTRHRLFKKVIDFLEANMGPLPANIFTLPTGYRTINIIFFNVAYQESGPQNERLKYFFIS